MKDPNSVEFGDKKFLEGYRFMIEHAQSLIKSAELLADNKLFGLATSVMIIAAEETVKAYFTFGKYADPDSVTEDEFENSFKYHSFKFKNIKGMKEWGEYFKVLFEEFYMPILLLSEGTSKAKTKKIRQVAFNKAIERLKDSTRKENVNKEKEWWNRAQTIKETGLYVNKTATGWILPSKIAEKDYKETKRYVLEFYEVVEASKLYLIDANIEILKKVRELTKQYTDSRDR